MKPKIKIGDSMIVVKNYDNAILFKKIGTVVWCSERAVSLEFDFRFNGGHSGHSGNMNSGKEGRCWNFPLSYVELSNKYAVELI